MRITELVDSLAIGGAERMVSDLAASLQTRGHALSVVCLRGGGPLAQPLLDRGIEVHTLGKGEGFAWKTAQALASHLRRFQSDVVHTHNPLVHHYGAIAGKLAHTPVVVNTFHGPGNLTGFGRTQMIFDASCLWSDRIVACCGAVATRLREVTLLAKRKLAVIPNGIPLDPFLRVQPRQPGSEFVIGAVGRLAEVKDHKSLLEAFAKMNPQAPASRLEILGDGPMRQELEQAAQRLGIAGQVIFHGWGLDVPGFLSRVDTFVLCSVSEGLPLTLIEAMASGIPVVGTNVGAIPELVEGAKCGWICPRSEPEQLAAALLQSFHCTTRGEWGRRGRQYVVERHSLDSMTSGYEQLFQDLREGGAAAKAGLKRSGCAA